MIIKVTNLETKEDVMIKNCSITEQIFIESHPTLKDGLYKKVEATISIVSMYAFVEKIMEYKIKIQSEEIRMFNNLKISEEDRVMHLSIMKATKTSIEKLEKILLSLVKRKKPRCEFHVLVEPSDCVYAHFVPNDKWGEWTYGNHNNKL